jgi:hypothetical protein
MLKNTVDQTQKDHKYFLWELWSISNKNKYVYIRNTIEPIDSIHPSVSFKRKDEI